MRVLSLGDLLLDVTVRFDPASGEADTAPDAVRIGPGGSAANFAVHAARLGADVRFVSRVGRDWPGEMLLRDLESEGVVSAVRVVDDAPTGRVLVMVDPGGNRRMFSYPGASSTLNPTDLDPGWFEGLSVFHLTGYSLLREGPREAALTALDMARRASPHLLATLDPNPGHLARDYGPARYRELLAQLQFDIIFPNLEEGRLLSGAHSPSGVAESLLRLSSLVVLTLGAQGSLVATKKESFSVRAESIAAAVDVTGAGDAFAAGYVFEYVRSGDAHKAATSATGLAAQVVGRVGAR